MFFKKTLFQLLDMINAYVVSRIKKSTVDDYAFSLPPTLALSSTPSNPKSETVDKWVLPILICKHPSNHVVTSSVDTIMTADALFYFPVNIDDPPL